MRNGRAAHRHVEHLAAGFLLALGYRRRNRVRLTEAHADSPIAVTNHDEGAEVKAATALDDLCDAPDLDDPVL
jgi:hypothetical protein